MDLSFHPGKPENFVFNFNSESSGLREAWGKTKFGELIEKPFWVLPPTGGLGPKGHINFVDLGP